MIGCDIMKRQINTAVHQLVEKWDKVAWNDFRPTPMDCSQMNRKGDIMCNDFMTLDTETSWNHDAENPIGWIYQWAFTYNGQIVYGRRPSELVFALQRIKQVNQLGEYALTENGVLTRKITIFVHNLSYDYAYFENWLRDAFGGVYRSGESKENLLAIAPHSLITYEVDGFRFKCSFKLTHKSLAQWGKDINSKHRKLVGAVDYDIVRYQDTKLNKNDWKYMFYDVIVLDECLRQQMKFYNDDLISIPLTVTGYVRREVRNEFMKSKRNHYKFLDRKLTLENYKMCREEFAGGLTHGNRYYASKTIRVGDVINGKEVKMIRHRDFRSHYPSQQRAYEFPIGRPRLYYDYTAPKKVKAPDIKKLLQLAKTSCVLCRLVISYAELRDSKISIPYLQHSKCYEGDHAKIEECILDNGRVLKFKGQTTITVNEDDLKILVSQYKMRYAVKRVVVMQRGMLPEFLINSIDKFFKGKTDYKDQVKALEELQVSGADPQMIEACINLMIAKGMLNGIYGMSATDPIRESFIEDYDTGDWSKQVFDDEEKDSELTRYYNEFTHFMNYQFGLYTTSHARFELIKFCMLIGWENVLYSDTDSIFYISDDDIEAKIENMNKECLEHSEKVGAYITSNKGKKVHYDQFELEKEEIVSFRFLHAKCYAYEVIVEDKETHEKKTELKCTIAGVKRLGTKPSGKKITREKELGGIDNLKADFIFTHCGGNSKIYPHSKPHVIDINGHILEVASSCILQKTTKTLHEMEDIILDLSEKTVFNEMECED